MSTSAVQRPRIHITAVGSSATKEVCRLSPDGVEGMIRLAQSGAGDSYAVTASPKMLMAREQDSEGGRRDDQARAQEVERLLADDSVAALVTIRGGAWFTRILDRIDFDVLRRRRRQIYLFGFSEMSSLIAIAGQYPQAVGVHDLGPGFLYGGPRWYACKHASELARHVEFRADQRDGFAAGWALANYPKLFTEFFEDLANILDGKGSARVPAGELLTGRLPAISRITITGGNLSVILPLIGSKYASAIHTRGKWLALEDINEAADPLDRMMAGLKLAGCFEEVQGILLGDFHDQDTDLCETAFKLLKYHLPPTRRIPVVRLNNFGHVWPLAPLPMHREVTLHCERPGRRGPARVWIESPWQQWRDEA